MILLTQSLEPVKEDIDSSKKVKIPKPKLVKTKGTPEVAVAILSDWQLAKVTPDYNSNLCEERIYRFAEKIIHLTNIQRKDHPVNELRIWALGDIIEGELIFPGQSFLIDGGLYRQITVDGPRIMKNFINIMLENFEKVTFVGIIGNHGSIGGRARKDHDPETNGDRMLYRITQLMFEKEPRLNLSFLMVVVKDIGMLLIKLANIELCFAMAINSVAYLHFMLFRRKHMAGRLEQLKRILMTSILGIFTPLLR